MSFTGSAVTFAAMVALGTAALNPVVKLLAPPPPHIVIHAITYDAGMITQDRTVRGDGPVFWMQWQAEIIDKATGQIVPGCEGSGSFNYPTGRKAATMTLQRWVGSDTCAPAPGGTYQPRAVYHWGDNQVIAEGEPWSEGNG